MRKGEGYFVGQVLALCPGWWQSPHSLARFAGGSSVGGLVVEVREAGEGEGVREGGWEGEIWFTRQWAGNVLQVIRAELSNLIIEVPLTFKQEIRWRIGVTQLSPSHRQIQEKMRSEGGGAS